MISWGTVGIVVGVGAAYTYWFYLIFKKAQEEEDRMTLPLDLIPEIGEDEMNPFSGAIFDCPQCSMPAEVASYVTLMDFPTNTVMTYVLINCVSDHDLVPVTEEEFVANILGNRG